MGLSDSYHHLDSPTNVNQNLWPLTPLGMHRCPSIHHPDFVHNKCASASLSGPPDNSGLKLDQLSYCAGTGPCITGATTCCTRGTTGCDGCSSGPDASCGCAGGKLVVAADVVMEILEVIYEPF